MEQLTIDEIVESGKCCGCGACRSLCPRDAIRMEIDREGFLSPVIDADRCSRCGLCRSRCPQFRSPEAGRFDPPAAYACWNLDLDERASSSSGGMFSVYARLVLDRGGTVFGAGLGERLDVRFAAARSPEELDRLRCSKYVQADTGLVYREVKQELASGREVLFAGSPCQVAGLYAFLNGDPPNLFTCDFLCHGVPSPLFYRKWVDHLERKFHAGLLSVNMRSKLCRTHFMGVELRFDNEPGQPKFFAWHDRDMEYLGRAFLKNYSLRKCCYACPYIKYPRLGDVTLADFWKLGDLGADEREKNEGVSLNLINSEKGARLREAAGARARFVPRGLAEAVQGNSTLRRHTPQPLRRDEFVLDSTRLDYETLIGKYRKELFGTFLDRKKAALKKTLRRWLKGR